MRKQFTLLLSFSIPLLTIMAFAWSGTGSGDFKYGPVRELRLNGRVLDLFICTLKPRLVADPEGQVTRGSIARDEDLAVVWLEPEFEENLLYSANLILEVVSELPLSGVRIDLYLQSHKPQQMVSLVLDLEPGFQQIQLTFDPIRLPENQPYLLYASLDPDQALSEYWENNNIISASLVPGGAAAYCFTLTNSFGYQQNHEGSNLTWRGQAFYRPTLHQTGPEPEKKRTETDQEPARAELAGGYLYYTLTDLKSHAVVDSDMVRTDNLGFWVINARVNPVDQQQYCLSLQLGDSGLVDETNLKFTHLETKSAIMPADTIELEMDQILLKPGQNLDADQDTSVSEPFYDDLVPVVGKPMTLSALINSSTPLSCVRLAWEILDSKGHLVTRYTGCSFSPGYQTLTSFTFVPPKADSYRVGIQLGDPAGDRPANESYTDLEIWQENLLDHHESLHGIKKLQQWLVRLEPCIFRHKDMP